MSFRLFLHQCANRDFFLLVDFSKLRSFPFLLVDQSYAKCKRVLPRLHTTPNSQATNFSKEDIQFISLFPKTLLTHRKKIWAHAEAKTQHVSHQARVQGNVLHFLNNNDKSVWKDCTVSYQWHVLVLIMQPCSHARVDLSNTHIYLRSCRNVCWLHMQASPSRERGHQRITPIVGISVFPLHLRSMSFVEHPQVPLACTKLTTGVT